MSIKIVYNRCVILIYLGKLMLYACFERFELRMYQ